MKLLLMTAAVLVSAYVVPVSYADMKQGEKSSKPMEHKQEKDKDQNKKKQGGDTGSMGEERTGGSGPSGTSGGENIKAPQHEGAGKKKQ